MNPGLIQHQLESRFALLVKTLGANEATEKKWANEFIARYNEPQRHYHTLTHIHSMLQCLDQFRPVVKDETALTLAIFFHDWIYDPKSKDNEMESVKCFKAFASEIGLSEAIYSRVAGYIERTITHSLPTDVERSDSDLCLFLDFDLEVLSRSETAYERYAEEIRAEYGHFEEADYCAGRSRVLRSFLGRDRLYFSDEFYKSREQKARVNLEQEISKLEAGSIST
ncbi:hypothetical protein M413DRAFT_445859 [Hebeloma cylindrosporum]|uniref:HD domain-containing protein n=1 Tax=Hebeloma cylindrosporum TaxID=76867 RepID=A0A0C3CC28_HEBCY|nr:hypothetical protein M413DRAFT_445859 [Hebeloma cylindrosporum h7]